MVTAATTTLGTAVAVLFLGAPAGMEDALGPLAGLVGLASGAGAAVAVRASGHGTKPRAAAFAAVGSLVGAGVRALLG